MRLQNHLRLPTRQRHDGHHEISHSVSSSRFPRRPSLTKVLCLSMPLCALLATSPAIAEPKPVGVWGWTTGGATNIRIRPGQQTPTVAKVPKRTQLMVWGTYNGWYRVETTDHKFGWIHHDYVNVPKADKLVKLSSAKARKASDSTGHQLLYGSPEQLKKYYATHKAPGAKKGLAKLGVSPTTRTPVKPVAAKAAPKKPAKQAAVPQMPKTVTFSPNIFETTETPAKAVVAKPVAKATVPTAPRPVVAKTLPQVKATTMKPAPVAKNTRITAEDIMRERERHIKNSPAFRRKTAPVAARKVVPRVEEKREAQDVTATIQPTSLESGDAATSQPVTFRTSATPIKNVKASSATPIKGKVLTATAKPAAKPAAPVNARGGSPRDYARYAQANGFGDNMAKQALSYRGMPYIRGASSPSRGFDCSGLIYHLLRQRGYNPPRTAAGMSKFGTPVAKNALKPGDIVFFANTYKRGVSHVGIYIGNNNFVHAANSKSGVRTDSLNSSYYRRKYWGARRLK